MKPHGHVEVNTLKKLVFIHGLLLSSWVFAWMQGYFTRRGYQCYQFTYSSRNNTISQSADQLYHWLVSNNIRNPYMICHSLGGLVCHAYLNDQIESEYLPLKVVCLGTPFKGSMVAKNLARYLPGKILLGAQASSVLVTGLKEWRSYCRLGIIAGSKNVGAGRLLGLDSHRPADGTVLVEETKIEGASDHIILPVSHSQMTFSTKVNLQIEHFMSNDIFKHENP